MESTKQTTLIEPTLRVPDLSNSFNYMGVVHSWLVNDWETEGSFMMNRFLARPGSEPPPHVHHFEHEIFHVLEGEIEFYIEGAPQTFLARPGSTMHLPRGLAHGLIFRTPHVCSLAMLHAVSGHPTAETFLRSMATGPATSMDLPESAPEYATMDPEQMQKTFRLAEENGFSFLKPEELATRLPLFASAQGKDSSKNGASSK